MRIYPVLDLLNGVVVRGVAGRRDTYRPIESRIVASSVPLDVARAFRQRFGLEQLYVADLDAILHGNPNLATYRQLVADGFTLLIDAGIKTVDAARQVIQAGATAIIAGLESIPNPDLLGELVHTCGASHVIFSLDLQAGQPLATAHDWRGLSPLEVAAQAISQGVRRLIVLDLAQVGIGQGISTLELCSQIRRDHSQVELMTGGGVRNEADLQHLSDIGIEGLLVASALHDGSIGPDFFRDRL